MGATVEVYHIKHITCLMWSVDLGNEMHEDPTIFRSGVCNRLFSIGEDGVYNNAIADVHYIYGSSFCDVSVSSQTLQSHTF